MFYSASEIEPDIQKPTVGATCNGHSNKDVMVPASHMRWWILHRVAEAICRKACEACRQTEIFSLNPQKSNETDTAVKAGS